MKRYRKPTLTALDKLVLEFIEREKCASAADIVKGIWPDAERKVWSAKVSAIKQSIVYLCDAGLLRRTYSRTTMVLDEALDRLVLSEAEETECNFDKSVKPEHL